MHAFRGVGQMSFVKHAIFVGEDAPQLEDHKALTAHILNRLHPDKILITQGIVDHLDHSSPEQLVGGKLGVDATGEEVTSGVEMLHTDAELLAMMQQIDERIKGLKQYMTDTKSPICVITVDKQQSQKYLISKLHTFSPYIKLLIIVDEEGNDLENPYMLIWRVVNNIDAQRDITLEPFIAVDGTNKNKHDGYDREWPGDTLCTREVLESLRERGLVEWDEDFVKQWGLL
jgi:4-hydroxy-3-polyprenylbenzoate decarboxylase